MTIVSAILKDISIFREILSNHAEKCDIFSLQKITLSVDFDVIERVTLLVIDLVNRNNGNLNSNIAQRCAISCSDSVQWHDIRAS